MEKVKIKIIAIIIGILLLSIVISTVVTIIDKKNKKM